MNAWSIGPHTPGCLCSVVNGPFFHWPASLWNCAPVLFQPAGSVAELDEILEMSDRIGVMYRGEIVRVLDGPTADKNEVGILMATGGATQPAHEAEVSA